VGRDADQSVFVQDGLFAQHTVEISAEIVLVVGEIKATGLPSRKKATGDSVSRLPLRHFGPDGEDFPRTIGGWNASIDIATGKISPRDPVSVIEGYSADGYQNVPGSQMVAIAIGFGFQNEVVSTIIFPINPRTAGRHPNLP